MQTESWTDVCDVGALQPFAGVAALVDDAQVALFYLPGNNTDRVFAIGNYDPMASHAAVLASGIIADIDGEPTVASPLYKHHYRLRDGVCIESPEHSAGSRPARIRAGRVQLQISPDHVDTAAG
ncbi:MAG: nitrite reductase small subunit NirD [Pseudomonadota bacterium]